MQWLYMVKTMMRHADNLAVGSLEQLHVEVSRCIYPLVLQQRRVVAVVNVEGVLVSNCYIGNGW